MARRFTCTEGGSNKFWEASTDGSSITTHWGRTGTNGQSKTKKLDSPEAAKEALEKLIHEKLAEGYIEEMGPINPAATPRSEAKTVSLKAVSPKKGPQ